MLRTLRAAGLAAMISLGLAAPASAADFDWVRNCPDEPIEIEALKDARCGWLTVQENRKKPNGRTIRLPVARFDARPARGAGRSGVEPDPIVYMEGGPGGTGLAGAEALLRARLNADRALILVGQRGSVFARPALTCREVDDFNATSAGLAYDSAEMRDGLVQAHDDCHDRLVRRGIDLSAYDTTANAADFADLRTAMGYRAWNVFGASYGTDLALTYMRDHPEGVRSVTIDSVVPPDRATLALNWDNAGRGMERIFRACREQLSCWARYPELRETFTRVVQQFEARPLSGTVVPVLKPGERPDGGDRAVFTTLDGGGFATWVFGLTDLWGRHLPRIVDELAHRDPATQREVLASYAATRSAHAGLFNWGLHNGVVCSEWVPYEDRDETAEAGRRRFGGFPATVWAQAPQFPFMREICKVWPVARAPASQREVVRSEIPTLLVGGTFDAITAVDTADDTYLELKDATRIAIRGAGHFVVPKSDCARDVMIDFLDELKKRPDIDCVRKVRIDDFVIGR